MDVDQKYPALSYLAKSNGTSLNALGSNARVHDDYLQLADCCQFVREDRPRCASGDPYDYLATLEAFIGGLPVKSNSRKTIWPKITGSTQSMFLDTLIEAAWVLRFTTNGTQFEYEAKFEPTNAGSKNADFRVAQNAKQYWLDALSVGGKESLGSWAQPINLVRAARTKYETKFTKAVADSLPSDCEIGVLVCIFKSKETQKGFWSQSNNAETKPPLNLFDAQCPRFSMVCVHTLCPHENAEFMKPAILKYWMRDEVAPPKWL